MTFTIALQFLVVLAAIWMGARSSGVGLGLWGAVGLLVLVAGFGINPTSPPIDVMLIILAVILDVYSKSRKRTVTIMDTTKMAAPKDAS